MRKIVLTALLTLCAGSMSAQGDFREEYENFRKKVAEEYSSFRQECNHKYAEFLRQAWDWYEGKAPMPKPVEPNPVPPRPYVEEDVPQPVVPEPVVIEPVEPIAPEPQPKPIEPVKEVPTPKDNYFDFKFYGADGRVRLPEVAKVRLKSSSKESLADGWNALCVDEMNNAIRDCLELRIRYNLCDWAYLKMLEQLGHDFCDTDNDATLLTAYLYCQSGYQMRLAWDKGRLVMLYGSKHQIFDKGYFVIDGICFYPLTDTNDSMQICAASFEGETPMSLLIHDEQKLGGGLSDARTISSKRYGGMSVASKVPVQLVDFFNDYPSSAINGNPMTRWAMYANTPLAEETKKDLYPALRDALAGKSKLESAEMLLNWVQTGFEYEYDDKEWGGDRAFFAEESLYYPYCDCEDRSILFSRLVRDLLGLDVALIYYPGHLATAVKFEEETKGASIMIDGSRYVICDPTYIGAPVGAQMPGLEYDKTQAIPLNRTKL